MILTTLGALASFFWYANTLAFFTQEFRDASPSEHHALFEKYYGKLTANQMATAIESTSGICHGQTHELGKVVYAHTKDIGEAFRECGKSCTEGCFHGVLMAALGADNAAGIKDGQHIKLADLSAKVSDICATAQDHRPGNCAHGIGHAFTYLADYRPDIALPLCESFPTLPLKFYCAGGTYMEFDMNKYDLVCDDTTPYTAVCWTYKARHFIGKTKSFGEASEKCLALPGLQRRGCFRGLGFMYMGTVENYPDLLPSICNAGDLDDKIVCIEGVIEKLADAHEARAIEACKYFGEPLRAACDRAARDKLYALDKPFERYLKAE